jgi:hypothetical protein
MRSSRITLGGICVLLAAFLSVAYLSACQNAPSYLSALVTPKGVKAEALLPEDSYVVVKLGTDDSAQLKSLEALKAKFPQEDLQKIEGDLLSVIDRSFAESGVSFFADVVPVIGENPQGIAAIAGKKAEGTSPDVAVAVKVADEQKAQALLAKLEGSGFQKQSYKSFDVYVEGSNRAYIVLYQDVLLVTNRIALIQKGIDGVTAAAGTEAAAGTLLENPVYQKGLAKLNNPPGFLFFNVQAYFGANSPVADNPALKGLEAEILGLSAENDGIRVRFLVYGDEKLLKESQLSFINAQSVPAYLYKKMDAKDLIFYYEGYGLGKFIEMESEAYRNTQGFDKLAAGLVSLMKSAGIDPSKDLSAFTDKGYALMAVDNGSSVPTLAFIVDAASNPSAVKKVTEAIFDSIEKVIASADADTKKIVTHKKSGESGGVQYVLKVDLKAVNKGQTGEESTAVAPGSPESLEFDYGLDADNLFYVGLNFKGLAGQNGAGLDGDAEFVKARSYIQGFDRGLIYLDPAPMLKYADRIVENTVKHAAMSEQDQKIYQSARGFISHVKSVIFGNAGAAGDSVETQGFVRIE